jgi:hypothetical protein
MIGALLYLRLTSLWNFALFRLRRLRQPKYLVGTAVAVAYIYVVLLRRPGMAGAASAAGPGSARIFAVLIFSTGSALALARIAFAWIAPAENPGLRFSEAEIAFLFPAPVTRRTLIHFRLLTTQLAILFTSVLIVFVFGRLGGSGGGRLTRAVGWWVILSVYDLHLNGTNLALARLKEKGSGYLAWRAAAVSAIALYAVAVAWSAAAFIGAHPADALSGRDPGGLLRGLADSSPLRWIVLPFTVVFAPYFAEGAREFALAIVPALGMLALHYWWVSTTEARFEEGSIALAERRAAAKAAALRGDARPAGARGPVAGPFPLPPHGPPETAFLWKNLLSMRNTLLTRRTIVIFFFVILWMSSALKGLLSAETRSMGSNVFGPLILAFCATVAAYTLLAGPQIARQDLRNDLPNMDILKTYPIEGWRMALGELLAPTAVLSLVLWICIAVCTFAVDPQGERPWLTPAVRATAALCLGLAAPVLCLILLIVPNSFMLLLPGWYQAARSRGGIEQFGQRMILGVGQLLIALFLAVPAAGTAALVVFSTSWVLGAAPAIILATAVALAIMAAEAVVGLWWLGEMFGRFDLSTESK